MSSCLKKIASKVKICHSFAKICRRHSEAYVKTKKFCLYVILSKNITPCYTH